MFRSGTAASFIVRREPAISASGHLAEVAFLPNVPLCAGSQNGTLVHGSRLRASVRSIPQLKSGDLPASAADPSAPMGCRRRRIRLRWGSARKIVLQGLVTTVLPSAVYTSDGMDGPIAPNLASSGRNIGPIHFECISAQHYHLTGVVISPDRANQRAGDLPVQPHFQKYFRSRLTQIKSISSAVPSPRGAYRDRHGRGAGCGGRGSVGRAM